MTSIPSSDTYTVIDVWYHLMNEMHADKASADWVQPPGIEGSDLFGDGLLANDYAVNKVTRLLSISRG